MLNSEHILNGIIVSIFQKRKTLRASLALQRQYNVGLGTSNPGTISLAVDNHRYPSRIAQTRGPERAWPGETDPVIRNRRLENDSNKCFRKPPPPRYTSGYTTDVSHLIV